MENLIDLAPPGIDEILAVLSVASALLEPSAPVRYDVVVLDTAPTGHALRMIAMPELALEWIKAVLGVLLKYREVVGLGHVGAGAGHALAPASRTARLDGGQAPLRDRGRHARGGAAAARDGPAPEGAAAAPHAGEGHDRERDDAARLCALSARGAAGARVRARHCGPRSAALHHDETPAVGATAARRKALSAGANLEENLGVMAESLVYLYVSCAANGRPP